MAQVSTLPDWTHELAHCSTLSCRPLVASVVSTVAGLAVEAVVIVTEPNFSLSAARFSVIARWTESPGTRFVGRDREA